MTKWQKSFIAGFIKAGAVATALIALVAAWHLFGGDSPAWSSDLRKLDARQSESAIDTYTKAIRDDTILKSQVNDRATQALIDERLREYHTKLKAAQDRKIELGK